MILSIYTPTHNPKWLKQCWESIKSQADGLDIEWVVVPNGNARVFGMGLPDDPRIKIIPTPGHLKGVGALKKFAVSQCKGDVFVELDHDDTLLPGCLEAITKSLYGKQNAFFYSSTVLTHEDGRPNLHGKNWGWEWATDPIHGPYNVGFEASWRSLCEIFYAPNHVRAWTRGAYEKAGGYNDKLEICDDHDLLCRTYLAGAEFIFDPRPLYRQVVHSKNTQKELNTEIQKIQAQIRDYNLHELAKEWSRRKGLHMIDLGGAFSCPEGFVPVDIRVCEGGVKVDLSKDRLPFDDHSVGIVRACDFLEHIPIGRVVPLINDIHRVLAPGGLFYSSTPSTDGRGAFQDPTHVSFWCSNSFFYYTREEQAKYVPEITAKFQQVGMANNTFGEFNKLHNIIHCEATLAALHGQRQPGAVGFPR